MLWDYPLIVKCIDTTTNAEYEKVFETKQEHIDYIKAQFKRPGQYNLKNTERWQDAGNAYAKSQSKTGRPNFEGGRYVEYPKDSYKEKIFFQQEKQKVLNGYIVDGWYIPGFYSWYLNFCPIVDAVKKKKKFGDVWDSDFWFFQYIMLCMLLGKHAVVVKARQRGYSLKIMALLYWSYCWFEISVNTVGAYKEEYVTKSWRFLDFYRKHINSYTRWIRGPVIPKSLHWEESTMTDEGKPYGLDSKLSGTTFKVSPENGVGGSQTIFFYEEAGIAPTLLKTVGYVRPALERGNTITGLIIVSGAVGELDDAQDLKEIFYNPDKHNFLSVENVWDEDENKGQQCGLFVSEAYNAEGFMDKDGNSDVESATAFIIEHNEKNKKNKRKDLAQLDVSQKPLSPKQAFAERSHSEFPIDKLRRQQEIILHKEKNNLWEFKPLKGLFKEDSTGRIVLDKNHGPEHAYPIKPDWEDKRGCWTLYMPIPETIPEKYLFFACVDSVEVDETETSESVASIDIYMAPIFVDYTDEKGVKRQRIEGDKLVATYRGRFKTAEQTNEQMWYGIKVFNAWTYAERNKPNFINYMRKMGRAESYLAKESDVPLFKDMNIKNGNIANNSKFGFHKGDNTEIWKYFKSTAKEYFATEYGRQTFEKDGLEETLKLFTGIDRIDDYWLLEEFCLFVEGKGNYDRLVSFMGALFICKTYQQNRFVKRRDETKKPEKKQGIQKKPVINMLGGNNRGYKSLL